MVEQIAMRCGLWRLVGFTSAEGSNPGQPMAHVKGIRNLSELAVADAVDPGGDLFADHFADAFRQAILKRRLIEVSAYFTRFEKRENLGWSRQAPDMGRQNSVGAGLHAWVVPSNEARSTMSCTSSRSVQGFDRGLVRDADEQT
jgi:hypothetical protein